MSRLAELQARFQQCVLNNAPGQQPQPWVSANGRAGPERQLSVYLNAYSARLTEVLGNDYPAVLAALGEEAFEQLAHGYIAAHPSHSFTLRDFGRGLAGFVNDTPERRDPPWLVELVRFEWTLGQAFDAADAPLAGIEHVAAIAPERWPTLRFHFHPSVQRIDLTWNTAAIWSAVTAEHPTHITATIGEPVPWLIWREQLVTRFRSLETDEAAALDDLRAGGTFGDACERLAAWHDEAGVPLCAASLLKGWLGQGLISRAD